MQENNKASVLIKDRATVRIEGVKGISAFDDNYSLVDTVLGRLCIEGEGLIIDELDKSTTTVSISGKINACYYSDSTKKGKGLFR